MIHRNILPTFDSQANPLPPTGSGTKNQITSGEKMISLARERGYPLDRLLCCELVDNQILFDSQEFFTKTDKHLLTIELDKFLVREPILEYEPKNDITCCIVDCMSYLRKLSLPTVEDKTFKGFCKSFFNILDY